MTPTQCPPDLKQAALDARDLLYSPYSKFRVGAAVLGEDGRIAVGANVENASYPAGICAERVAYPRALMEGLKPVAIAVTSDNHDPILPCGVCRQFLSEFGSDLVVHMVGKERVVTATIGELLPMGFGSKELTG